MAFGVFILFISCTINCYYLQFLFVIYQIFTDANNLMRYYKATYCTGDINANVKGAQSREDNDSSLSFGFNVYRILMVIGMRVCLAVP